MAIIGTFTKQEDGSYSGTIQTLTLSIRATFEPTPKRGDKSPEFRINSGLVELGAAWERPGDDGKAYLSVRLDDPSFAVPINCRLTKTGIESGYSLLWERDPLDPLWGRQSRPQHSYNPFMKERSNGTEHLHEHDS